MNYLCVVARCEEVEELEKIAFQVKEKEGDEMKMERREQLANLLLYCLEILSTVL